MEIITITIRIFASIISSMVLFFLQKNFKKMDVKNDEKEKAKAHKSILILKNINQIFKQLGKDKNE